LQVNKDTVSAFPPQWTDLIDPSPEEIMGKGQCLFRLEDLMKLAQLVDHLCQSKEKG
jgi:hypothetical protein